MSRITLGMLEKRVEYLNSLVKSERFELSFAYGGVNLVENGGSKSTFTCGHMPKKELFDKIYSLMEGIRIGLELWEVHQDLLTKEALRKDILGE
jgi:hypothetical protein